MAIAHLKPYDAFVEFFTSSPTLEQIVAFRRSEASEARIAALLEINRTGTLSPTDADELDELLRLEHSMRKAKIRAFERLDARLDALEQPGV